MASLQGGITIPDTLSNVVDNERVPQAIRITSEFDAIAEDGGLFFNSPIFTVPSLGSYNLFIVTSPTATTSARLEFLMRTPGVINIFSNPTLSGVGTISPNGNHNLGSTVTSNLVLRTGVTTSNNGTKISDFLILGSTQGSGFGASAVAPAKVVIPPNSAFLIMFNNDDATPAKATVVFNWYETPLA